VKSHPNLWPRITSFENLYEAFRRARRGKRTRADVASFEWDLESNLFELQRDLSDATYRPGGYRNFVVHEPTERKISAAPFRDRVVHHALCRVIEPVFERTFLPHSFANRVGKGTHRALRRGGSSGSSSTAAPASSRTSRTTTVRVSHRNRPRCRVSTEAGYAGA
jgi:retron-type reverse transcriptase